MSSYNSTTTGLIFIWFCIGGYCFSVLTYSVVFIREHEKLAFTNWKCIGNLRMLQLCHAYISNISYFSYITVTFVIEAMALASAIVNWKRVQKTKEVSEGRDNVIEKYQIDWIPWNFSSLLKIVSIACYYCCCWIRGTYLFLLGDRAISVSWGWNCVSVELWLLVGCIIHPSDDTWVNIKHLWNDVDKRTLKDSE